mgnify:CR=1 FL=1
MPTTNTHAPCWIFCGLFHTFAVLDGFFSTTSASEHWWRSPEKNGVPVAYEAVFGAEWLFEEWP